MTKMVETVSGSRYFFMEHEGTLRLFKGVTEYLVLKISDIRVGMRMEILAIPFDQLYNMGAERVHIETTPVVLIE